MEAIKDTALGLLTGIIIVLALAALPVTADDRHFVSAEDNDQNKVIAQLADKIDAQERKIGVLEQKVSALIRLVKLMEARLSK